MLLKELNQINEGALVRQSERDAKDASQYAKSNSSASYDALKPAQQKKVDAAIIAAKKIAKVAGCSPLAVINYFSTNTTDAKAASKLGQWMYYDRKVGNKKISTGKTNEMIMQDAGVTEKELDALSYLDMEDDQLQAAKTMVKGKQPVQEAIAAEIKNDSYVKITSGEYKYRTGYISKLIKSKGEVTAVEVELDDEDNEYVKFTPDQLKVIRESMNEASSFVLELQKAGKCIGYYVSDDRRPAKSVDKALKFKSMAEARREAKLCNNQWDLEDSQKFVAVSAEQQITEAKQYEESSDFDADFNTLEKHLKDAKDIVKSAAWQKHMKDTDTNFDTSVVEMSRRAMDKLQLAIEAFDNFYEYIQEAA